MSGSSLVSICFFSGGDGVAICTRSCTKTVLVPDLVQKKWKTRFCFHQSCDTDPRAPRREDYLFSCVCVCLCVCLFVCLSALLTIFANCCGCSLLFSSLLLSSSSLLFACSSSLLRSPRFVLVGALQCCSLRRASGKQALCTDE